MQPSVPQSDMSPGLVQDSPRNCNMIEWQRFESIPLKGSSLAREVFEFFGSYDDTSGELYPRLPALVPPLDDLDISVKDLLSHCTTSQQTKGEARKLFTLLTQLEGRSSSDCRPISRQFKDASSFDTYLDNVRKWQVKNEGWKRALIRSEFGLNESGVFRSVIDLMYQQLEGAGGLSAIVPFSEEATDGKRCYSAPWNASAMEEYEKCLPAGFAHVGIDLYSDGATLAKSGSQSANSMRVRFVNIAGMSQTWHEIGIAPAIDTDGEVRTDIEKRKERMVLFQRYVFLVLRDVIKASSEGVLFDGRLIFPRVTMIVSDQKQERSFLCLMGAGSYTDCSFCIMPSRIPRKRLIPQDLTDTETSPRKKQKSVSGLGVHHITVGAAPREPLGRYDDLDEDRVEADGDGDGSNVERGLPTKTDEVFLTQTALSGAAERDVEKTVSMQLLVACHKRSAAKTSSLAQRKLVKRAKKYLEEMSAQEFPPSLAAFEGLGSKPFRLYRSIAFDKLHAFDLGPLRQIPDDLHTIIGSSPEYKGISKAKVISTMNQRMLDVPRAARLGKFAPFRNTSNEKHAGMTGKVRREMLPFLWYCVMGVAPNVVPDKDPVLKMCLLWDAVQRLLSGINQGPREATRDNERINELQTLCFEAGKATAAALRVNVNTKLHRLMRHVKDHIIDFGCLRKGSTDENEALHKTTKKAYASTNRHVLELAPQLLAARAAIECQRGDHESVVMGQIHARLLLTRQTAVAATERNVPPQTPAGDLHSAETAPSASLQPRPRNASFEALRSMISSTESVEAAEAAVENVLHPSTNERIWRKTKSAKFLARLPWWPDNDSSGVSQTVYAGDNVFGTQNRRDAVQYTNGNEKYIGIVQAVFRNTFEKMQIALVRRLKEIPPDAGNVAVVNDYGNTHFAYESGENDIFLDCVPITSFVRSILIVPDPWCATKRHGLEQRLNQLPDVKESRMLDKFFEVRGYQYSSIPEKTC